jgi:hypothetical protein
MKGTFDIGDRVGLKRLRPRGGFYKRRDAEAFGTIVDIRVKEGFRIYRVKFKASIEAQAQGMPEYTSAWYTEENLLHDWL